uniref:Tick transposon n=1 Tax=Rhipicephalus pulchellus TaxID=72859 RepID=L7LZN0_RHIPC
MVNLFLLTLYPSYCPFCGSVPTVYHSTWECPGPQGTPTIRNPTPPYWESALLNLCRREQKQLVQRAPSVALGNGALD